ncbi:MAG TPA: multiheme c-type cytochrome [Thermodesulfobacteriota bacterium]|nr:multiheme c-type cytochrome [Thermodesulfobacteriota bacterium]
MTTISRTHKRLALFTLVAGFIFWVIYRFAPYLPIPGVEKGTVYLLGIVAVLLILFVMTYSLRKRVVKGVPGRLDNWLWAHIYLGILALFIIALHAEFRFGWDYNTAAVIFLALVIITGVVGRYFFTRFPSSIASEQEKVISQLDEVKKSINELMAGSSRPFQKIIGSELNTPSPLSPTQEYWEELLGKGAILQEEEKEDFRKAVLLLEQKAKLDAQSVSQLKYKPLFRGWLVAHLVVTGGLIVLIPLHILDDSFRAFQPTASDFGSPQECRQCHQRQYDEWIMSMHAYGQVSPVAFELNAKVQEDSKGKVGVFCFKCHAPVSIAIGEDAIMPNDKRAPIGVLGVQCDSCHTIGKDHGLVSGDFPLEPGRTKFGPFGAGSNGDSKPVRNSFHKSLDFNYLKTSEFCGSCHDVVTPKGLRVEETFAEWKDSIYAKKGITCQECHMRTIPGKPGQKKVMGPAAIMVGVDLPERLLSNHSMIGVDYHLVDFFPYPDNPAETEGIQREYMQEVYELHKGSAQMKVEAPTSVTTGSEFQVAVHVTNVGAGHHLPSGFTVERQLWIEIIVKDADGKLLFVSGDLDGNYDLRNRCSQEVKLEAAPLDEYLVNFQSEMIRVNPDGIEEDVFLTSQANKFVKKGIPPLETRSVLYPITVPPDAKGPLKVDVRLRFRNLSPLIFDRLGLDEKLKKRLRIIDLATESKSIEVEANGMVTASQQVSLSPNSGTDANPSSPSTTQGKIVGIIMSIDNQAGTISLTDAQRQKHVIKIDPKLLEGIAVCNKVEVEVENGVAKSIKKL